MKLFWIVTFLVILLGTGLVYMSPSANGEGESVPDSDWLAAYWHRPLAPQGSPPESFSDLEASLLPEDCGTCHEDQYEAWQTSRHGLAMGYGIMSQFGPPWLDDGSVAFCQECHAPLYEQQPLIAAGRDFITNRLYVKKLRKNGVACAVCHVRKHVRHGPPPRKQMDPDTPHNGFKIIKDFNRSEFCKSCHQFNPGERSLNGKLVQDTYEQWKASTYASQGVQCANCHMPDRRHGFAGIHSPEMVKKAMTIKVNRESNSATIYITNSGAGHKLPTYLTPKIAVTGRVITREGEIIKETVEEKAIQWLASLDLRQEHFDTRLDPGETFTAKFDFPEKYRGNIYEIEVRVYPDEFYRRFYESLLERPPGGIDVEQMKLALEEARTSDFAVYNRRLEF